MSAALTRSHILDAVLACVQDGGLSGLSVETVAERAGVSRQTVYRHFVNRPRLIEAAILREEQAFIDQMLKASSRAASLEDAVRTAVKEALRLGREHPLLNRLVQSEPASLLPYLLLGRGPVISAAEPAVEDLVRRHCPDLTPSRLSLVVDMSTRLLVSYVVSRDDRLTDEELATAMGTMVASLVND